MRYRKIFKSTISYYNMVKLATLEDVLRMPETTSPGYVAQPIQIYYLPSVVQTAKKIPNGQRALEELAKFHVAAIRHGFRGHSSGGKNGVVIINKTNAQLFSDYEQLFKDNKDVLRSLGADIFALIPIKVVAHVKNGNRLIGAIDRTSRPYKVYVLGMSNYSGKIA